MSGTSYRLNETYATVGTKWKYLYRADDYTSKTIEFMLSAKRFFKKVLRADYRRLPFPINYQQCELSVRYDLGDKDAQIRRLAIRCGGSASDPFFF